MVSSAPYANPKLTFEHRAANFLSIFSPILTLVVYAIQAQLRGTEPINAQLAFTSLALINMVTQPANTLLVLIPNIATFIAGFDRVQKYLTSPDREDKRGILDTKYANRASGGTDGNGSAHHSDHLVMASGGDDADVAISIDHVVVRPAKTADPVLKNISTNWKKGSLVVCSGAVGTGKTTLAKALLGDLPPDSGVIKTAFGSVAYCAQTAWLINGTIQDVIRGPPGDSTELDEAWYRRVLHACDLEEDLRQLPDGDQTVVGSRGITLSGGQKQRVVRKSVVSISPGMVSPFSSRLVQDTDMGVTYRHWRARYTPTGT